MHLKLVEVVTCPHCNGEEPLQCEHCAGTGSVDKTLATLETDTAVTTVFRLWDPVEKTFIKANKRTVWESEFAATLAARDLPPFHRARLVVYSFLLIAKPMEQKT